MSENATEIPHKVVNALEKMYSYGRTVRDNAFQELLMLNQEAVVKALTDLLNVQDTNIRCRAAETLFRLDPSRGAMLIMPHLNSSDSTFRWLICGLLSNHGDTEAIQPLVNVLKNDPEADIRMIAAFALGRVGDQRALPALKWAAKHDNGKDYEGRLVSDVATDAIKEILIRHSTDNAL